LDLILVAFDKLGEAGVGDVSAPADLVAAGARIVSLNPLRGTLEDFFVQQVRATDEAGIVRERNAS